MIDLSKAGQLFISSFEGFSATCYDDGGKPGVGNCTIGFGHLVHMGPTTPADRARIFVPGGKPGLVTRDQALGLLHKDAAPQLSAIRTDVKVPLTQGQQDALISLGYNCGPGAIHDLARVVNTKPRKWNPIKMRQWRSAVTAQFLRWDHVDGKVWAGLLRRRTAESYLFRTGKYTRAQGNTWANA